MYNFFINSYIIVLKHSTIYNPDYTLCRYGNTYNDGYENKAIIN